MVLVALVGPGMNLALATIAAVALGIAGATVGGPTPSGVSAFLLVNVSLALFNLLPLPPFDGGHVVEGILPRRLAYHLRQAQPVRFPARNRAAGATADGLPPANIVQRLVNNAGISTGWGPPSEDTMANVRAIYEVNVFGAIRVRQAFLPLLKASSAPRIVMTSSSLGSLAWASDFDAPMAQVNLLGYNSSKSALNALTVAFAKEPGASPGTMTVNGNVALAGSSTSLFEITSNVSDKLIVNGTLSIANGATLQLAQTGKVLPGTTLDLITASGGITGSFTTVQRNGSAFALFSQDSTRLLLMATFFKDTTFNATAQRGVDYLNGVLLGGRASPSLLAAVPLLLTASGDTNAAAFTQIAPQAYAAARQISIDNGLILADAARGQTFEPTRDTPGLFSFASAVGGTRTLDGDPIDGTARATTNGYGFLGGIGFAGTDWSLGAFGGYLNDRQTLAGLGARTNADGVVAGVHGRVRYRGIGLKVTFAYDGAQADTRRTVPGGTSQSRYDLHGWTVDANIDTLVSLTGHWSVRPSVGATMIRTNRDGVTGSGNSPFALAVAGRRGTAVFVDGGATFAGATDLVHAVTARPYLTLGARYQAQGRTPYALAGFGGGAIGATRRRRRAGAGSCHCDTWRVRTLYAVTDVGWVKTCSRAPFGRGASQAPRANALAVAAPVA